MRKQVPYKERRLEGHQRLSDALGRGHLSMTSVSDSIAAVFSKVLREGMAEPGPLPVGGVTSLVGACIY